MRTASMLTMPPPKQKPTAPSLPVQSGRDFSHVAAAKKSSRILAASICLKSSTAFFVISGIAAGRGQPIGSKRDELGHRQPPRHILYVRIEATVLVHNQHRGQFSRGVCRADQVAADASIALRRRHGRRFSLDPAVVFLDLGRPRIIRPEHLEQRGRRYPADGKFLRAVEKLAAINAAVHVPVKQIQELLGEIGRFLSLHRNTPGC